MEKQIVFADDIKGNVNVKESDIVYATFKTVGTIMNVYVDLNLAGKPEQHKRLTKLTRVDALNTIDLDGDTRNMIEETGAGENLGYTLLINVNRVRAFKRNAANTATLVWIIAPGNMNVPVLEIASSEADFRTAINVKVTAAYEEQAV